VSRVTGAQCSGEESSLSQCELQWGPAASNVACEDGATSPANVGVRCTNFVADEQPNVIIDEGRHTKEELRSLLGDSGHQLRCKADPVAKQPSFVCAVTSSRRVQDEASPEVCEHGETGSCASSFPQCEPPNPFDLALSKGVFVFEAEMQSHLKASERLRQLAMQNNTHPCGANVEVNPLGLRVQPSSTKDADTASLKALYLSSIGRIFMDLDSDVYGITGPKAASRKPFDLSNKAKVIYTELEKHGVARIEETGLDLPALQLAVKEAFARMDPKLTSSTTGGVVATREKLAPLEKWLREDKAIPSALSAYLGGEAVLHGYKAVHLPATLSTDAYVSAHWHHDRAGRRLKLFILLHDVDAKEGHPTQVAKGSHDLLYYWHEEFAHSRYTNEYVQSNFDVELLAGQAGNAYVFDTNTVHKGTPEGSREREVVIVEFHHAAKCGIIDNLGLNVPCPSGDQRPLNWYSTASEGVLAADME